MVLPILPTNSSFGPLVRRAAQLLAIQVQCCSFSFRRCCLLGGWSAGNEGEWLVEQRGTNSPHRGIFLKFMFISVLKRVESLFKSSSAAAIDVEQARGCCVWAGRGPGPLLLRGTGTDSGDGSGTGTGSGRAGGARGSAPAVQPQRKGQDCTSEPAGVSLAGQVCSHSSSLLFPRHKPLLPTVLKSSVSVLECSTEGETS